MIQGPVASLPLHMIIDTLSCNLFQGEEIFMDRQIERLVERNCRLIQNEFTNGFIYKGNFFRSKVQKAPRMSYLPPLHPDLEPEMDKLMADRQQRLYDKAFINQAIIALVSDLETLQDIRDALPDLLVNLCQEIPGMRSLSRTRPPGFNQTSDFALKQFNRLVDKIQFYAATRLLI